MSILILLHKHSPNGTTQTRQNTEHIRYSLLLNLSTLEGLKAELA